MSLTSRVDPFGNLFADSPRGQFMGNRGRIHRKDKTLSTYKFAHQHWICCKLEFNNRHRRVWGNSYTELFFLDEVTAFAAGHRPCFECRRKDAEWFATLFCGKRQRASAATMDNVLHSERLNGRQKRTHHRALDHLPDGAMIALDGEAFAVRGNCLLRWTPSGYLEAKLRPRGIEMDVLTPPSTLAVFARGYAPFWHQSAAKY